jgi:integrase/recombinase XerD
MKFDGEEGVIRHFLLDMGMRRRSEHTLKSYRYILTLLARALDQVCQVTDIEQVTVYHLRQCVQFLLTRHIQLEASRRPPDNGETLSVSTIRGHIRVWKVLFNWCYQEELIDKNPVARLSSPKPDERVLLAFSEEQVQMMFMSLDTSTEMGFRDYLILLLLLDTGIRLSEIIHLDVSDVHDTYIKVFGKGRKEREIGVHPDVSKLLWKYIHKYRHPKDLDEKGLFLGTGKGVGKPLGLGGVKHLMDRLKKATGIGESMRLSAHVFRHTFAKMYLKQGGELFKLSREMGHSDVKTTQIYLKDFNSSEARKAHNPYSPINRFQLKKQHKRKKEQG